MPFKKFHDIILIFVVFLIFLSLLAKLISAQICDSCASNTFAEWISRIQFNGIDNPSGSTTCSDFTSISTDVNNGSSYTLTVNVSINSGTSNYCIKGWIDWDQDYIFDTNTEQYDIGCPVSVSAPWKIISNSIDVPTNVSEGNKRMRVTLKLYDPPVHNPPGPCENFQFGEVEDYTVNVNTTPTTTTTSTTTSTTTTEETTTTTTTTTTTIPEETTTTTTTRTTTTTTTLPTISLQCEKDEIYVKQKNKCNVTNCQEGYWLIKNHDGMPLSNETIEDIPPDEIEFGPTKEEGEVLTRVVCLNPSLTVNHTTLVKKGPVLLCPDTCYLDESCKCEVYECNEGLFLMDNYEGEPLDGDVINDVNDIEFKYDFWAEEEGKIRVRMICHDPYETEHELYINVIYPVTTTTLPTEFEISKKTVTETELVVDVNKNARAEDTVLYVQLIKEPEGIIYYTGRTNLRSGFVGDKTLSLTESKECPSGTELKLLMLAYSSTLQRLDRVKEVVFKC